MADKHLSNNEFLDRLTKLFDSRRTAAHGSVQLTQKRLTPPDLPTAAATTQSSPFPDLHPPHPLPILIRATNGKPSNGSSGGAGTKKLKLSTIVDPAELEMFFTRYTEVCKAGMTGLKKRDRSGRKAKAKGKKKQGKDGNSAATTLEFRKAVATIDIWKN